MNMPRYFFLHDTATPEIYTLSLHDALPISGPEAARAGEQGGSGQLAAAGDDEQPAARLLVAVVGMVGKREAAERSEEHTSELQSLAYLVCRLLLEKKNKN